MLFAIPKIRITPLVSRQTLSTFGVFVWCSGQDLQQVLRPRARYGIRMDVVGTSQDEIARIENHILKRSVIYNRTQGRSTNARTKLADHNVPRMPVLLTVTA